MAPGGNAAAATRQHPNVIVIQTDDQNLDEMYQTFRNPSGNKVPVMRQTLNLIAKHGATFTNYYVSDPLCAPSRASLLTGDYAHNTSVEGNGPDGPGGGGYPGFVASRDGRNNIAVWLQRSGYRTIHIGKTLNDYGELPYSSPTDEPPGWTDWETLDGESSTHHFYGYTINDNRTVEGPFGDVDYTVKDPTSCPNYAPPGTQCNYQTDVLTERAINQIDVSGAAGSPFFLSLDYIAPHGDYHPPAGPEPAPRYYDSLASVRIPRPPNFNEADVRDKPSYVRDLPPLTAGDIHSIKVEYQKELESLRSVDDGVAKIVSALRQTGQLRNTYIFFTSDNGYFTGEHRVERSKFLPYEPAVHLPLLVRGPGIKPNSKSGALVSNIDLTPTIAQVTGVKPGRRQDGFSLLRYARNPKLHSKEAVLLESFIGATSDAPSSQPTTNSAPPVSYEGIRVGPYKYVEYIDGERELYDLAADPYELQSRINSPRFAGVRSFLARQLRRLETCAGASCRAEIAAKIPALPKQRHHKPGH